MSHDSEWYRETLVVGRSGTHSVPPQTAVGEINDARWGDELGQEVAPRAAVADA
jgi:hypothetical protein